MNFSNWLVWTKLIAVQERNHAVLLIRWIPTLYWRNKSDYPDVVYLYTGEKSMVKSSWIFYIECVLSFKYTFKTVEFQVIPNQLVEKNCSEMKKKFEACINFYKCVYIKGWLVSSPLYTSSDSRQQLSALNNNNSF